MALADKLDLTPQHESIALRPAQRTYVSGLLNKYQELFAKAEEARVAFAEAIKFVASDLGINTNDYSTLLPDLSAFVRQAAPSLSDMKIDSKVN